MPTDNGYWIRQARIGDRQHFSRLWHAYLEEQFQLGAPVIPNDRNMLEYIRLFESYLVGSLFGFALLAYHPTNPEPVGVLLAGEAPPGGLQLETTQGRCATLWGVYVSPEHRRRGVAWLLQDQAYDEAARLGFKTGLSSVLLGYTTGESNAFGWGAHRAATLIAIPVGKEHRYGQHVRRDK